MYVCTHTSVCSVLFNHFFCLQTVNFKGHNQAGFSWTKIHIFPRLFTFLFPVLNKNFMFDEWYLQENSFFLRFCALHYSKILTEVHSVLICHSLQIFSWQVLVVSGFSRWWQRYCWTVKVRLAYICLHKICRCCIPRPHVLLHSDHSPISQLKGGKKKDTFFH